MRALLLMLTLTAFLTTHGGAVSAAEAGVSLLFSANAHGTFKPCPS